MTAGAKPRTSHHRSSGGDQGCEGLGAGRGGGGWRRQGGEKQKKKMEALPKNVHRKDDSEKRYCQLLKKQTLELCHEEKHGKNFRETYFPERSDDTIMN